MKAIGILMMGQDIIIPLIPLIRTSIYKFGLARGDDGQLQHAMVKKISVDQYREPVDNDTNDPITDSRHYQVNLFYGTTENRTSNTIAENFLAQVDEEVHCQILFFDIMDIRRSDDAVSIYDEYYETMNGSYCSNLTTKLLKIYVEYNDVSQTQVALEDTKICTHPSQLNIQVVTNLKSIPHFIDESLIF